MKEKGPGDLGAGGMESVLGRPGTLVGVIVPFSLELLSEDPSAPESLSASRICMHTQSLNLNPPFPSRISFQLQVFPAVQKAWHKSASTGYVSTIACIQPGGIHYSRLCC